MVAARENTVTITSLTLNAGRSSEDLIASGTRITTVDQFEFSFSLLMYDFPFLFSSLSDIALCLLRSVEKSIRLRREAVDAIEAYPATTRPM
jgi:hypothetical protein